MALGREPSGLLSDAVLVDLVGIIEIKQFALTLLIRRGRPSYEKIIHWSTCLFVPRVTRVSDPRGCRNSHGSRSSPAVCDNGLERDVTYSTLRQHGVDEGLGWQHLHRRHQPRDRLR